MSSFPGAIVLEWNGQSLADKTFEEVSAILDRSGDLVELLVETGRRLSPSPNISPNASTGMLKADSEENDMGPYLLPSSNHPSRLRRIA